MEQKSRLIIISTGVILIVVGVFLIFGRRKAPTSPLPEQPTVRVIFTSPPPQDTPTPFLTFTPTPTPKKIAPTKPPLMPTSTPKLPLATPTEVQITPTVVITATATPGPTSTIVPTATPLP